MSWRSFLLTINKSILACPSSLYLDNERKTKGRTHLEGSSQVKQTKSGIRQDSEPLCVCVVCFNDWWGYTDNTFTVFRPLGSSATCVVFSRLTSIHTHTHGDFINLCKHAAASWGLSGQSAGTAHNTCSCWGEPEDRLFISHLISFISSIP